MWDHQKINSYKNSTTFSSLNIKSNKLIPMGKTSKLIPFTGLKTHSTNIWDNHMLWIFTPLHTLKCSLKKHLDTELWLTFYGIRNKHWQISDFSNCLLLKTIASSQQRWKNSLRTVFWQNYIKKTVQISLLTSVSLRR